MRVQQTMDDTTASWTTFEETDEGTYKSQCTHVPRGSVETDESSDNEGSLDDTLPISTSEEFEMVPDSLIIADSLQPPRTSSVFEPDIARCSTAVKDHFLTMKSDVTDFQPVLCSTRLCDLQGFVGRRMSSFGTEFRPQLCSTGLNMQNSRSDLKIPLLSLKGKMAIDHSMGRPLKSSDFNPPLCSTTVSPSPLKCAPAGSLLPSNSSAFNPLFSSTQVDVTNYNEFKPEVCSSGLSVPTHRTKRDYQRYPYVYSDFQPPLSSTQCAAACASPASPLSGSNSRKGEPRTMSDASEFCPPLSSTRAGMSSDLSDFKPERYSTANSDLRQPCADVKANVTLFDSHMSICSDGSDSSGCTPTLFTTALQGDSNIPAFENLRLNSDTSK